MCFFFERKYMAELSPQPATIQSLYSLYSENKLFVNRRYQRKLVWTLHEKQKLIESIQKKYPIPAILIAEREKLPGTYEIIDGLQRLHAIFSFIENAYPTLDGKSFPLNQFPTAKLRADDGKFTPSPTLFELTPKEVNSILDYTLSLTVMRNATEDEVNDVFGRINTYGHRLSDQERRQAGMQSDFSELVRRIAGNLRGDETRDILLLDEMPSISIDLPMTKHGYEIKADEVMWVEHGILRSTDLRDSMDEQSIADIAACIVGGVLIERSKDALDEIYSKGTQENHRIEDALKVYGPEKFEDEFKYCIDEIIKITSGDGANTKLRDIIFASRTTNAFPSVFAAVVIAIHEITIQQSKKATNYSELKKALKDIDRRLETSRRATLPDERRKNIQTIKSLIDPYFVTTNISKEIYNSHTTSDINSSIRRSEIELSDFELKQGLLSLSDNRGVDLNVIEKVVNTICAIANNGPGRHGKIIIGVADKEQDANRIAQMDKVTPHPIGRRLVVGISREANFLKITTEKYFSMWKHYIRDSKLSSPLKEDILSSMDFHSYFGLGIIVLSIPPQNEVSMVGDTIYWREGDSTKEANSAKEIVAISKRFS